MLVHCSGPRSAYDRANTDIEFLQASPHIARPAFGHSNLLRGSHKKLFRRTKPVQSRGSTHVDVRAADPSPLPATRLASATRWFESSRRWIDLCSAMLVISK